MYSLLRDLSFTFLLFHPVSLFNVLSFSSTSSHSLQRPLFHSPSFSLAKDEEARYGGDRIRIAGNIRPYPDTCGPIVLLARTAVRPLVSIGLFSGHSAWIPMTIVVSVIVSGDLVVFEHDEMKVHWSMCSNTMHGG